MRITLFAILMTLVSVPNAFANSLSPVSVKGELSQAVFKPEWTGFYTGLLLGGQFGHSRDKTGSFGYNADNDNWSYHESGYNAGLELGYNYLYRQFVVGPEITLGYVDLQGRGAQPLSPGADTVGKTSSDFYTTLRARGGVDFNPYLLFLTGGAIGINYTTQVVDRCDIAPCGGSTVAAKRNGFVWGYTVGAGVERQLTQDWSLKFEYLYFNLNSQRFSGTTNLGNTYQWTGKTYGNLFSGGINYHF